MSHLDDLWSVMVIYFPGARGKVERSIEVNKPRPEIVPRYHGVLGPCKLSVITLSFLRAQPFISLSFQQSELTRSLWN